MDKQVLNKLLHQLIKTDCIDAIKIVIDQGADVDCVLDSLPPIWRALMSKKFDTVKLLIEKKADLNVRNGYGDTLLIYASSINQAEIAKLLLDNKCDYNIVNNNKENALYQACRRGNKEIIKLLLACPKIDIDTPNDNGFSMLYHTTCIEIDKEITEMLLAAGANPNVQNSGSMHDYTPLMGACSKGSTSIVKLLLKNPKIDLNVKDKTNRTALQIAEHDNHKDIVELLKEHGKSKLPCDKLGNTHPVLVPRQPSPVNVSVVCIGIPSPSTIIIKKGEYLSYVMWSYELANWREEVTTISCNSDYIIDVVDGKMLRHCFTHKGYKGDVWYIQFAHLPMVDGTVRDRADLYQ